MHPLNPHRNLRGGLIAAPFSSDEETATQRGEGMCAGGTSRRGLAAGARALALNQRVRYLGYSHLAVINKDSAASSPRSRHSEEP